MLKWKRRGLGYTTQFSFRSQLSSLSLPHCPQGKKEWVQSEARNVPARVPPSTRKKISGMRNEHSLPVLPHSSPSKKKKSYNFPYELLPKNLSYRAYINPTSPEKKSWGCSEQRLLFRGWTPTPHSIKGSYSSRLEGAEITTTFPDYYAFPHHNLGPSSLYNFLSQTTTWHFTILLNTVS